ncbi:MAG: hypothetical protein GX811_11365 [Lentisphaerae bacterium]|nr:hypothetical protein [Lentisphaerota bacterium]
MKPYENILSLFRRQGYEYVPPTFDLCPSLIETYHNETGTRQHYYDYYKFPWRYIPGPVLPPFDEKQWLKFFSEPLSPKAIFSPYGIAHEPGDAACFHLFRMKHPMLKFDSIEQFQAYPYPDYTTADYGHIKEAVNKIHASGLVALASMECTIWETAWYMRGMEHLMTDMIINPEMATYHLDKITDNACYTAKKYAEAGADIIKLGDDVGMQQSLLMSREMYLDWLYPRLKRVIDSVRSVKKDIIVSYHSCGYVYPLINDFISAGIDELNPVQPECMDFNKIHAEFGEILSFWGGVGTQTTMPFGTTKDVQNTVKNMLNIAGDKGGVLPAPTHLLEPEVPWTNIQAYIDACKHYTV